MPLSAAEADILRLQPLEAEQGTKVFYAARGYGSGDSERMATHFVLNTGAKIPSVGLGTWQADNGLVGDAVYAAVKVSKSIVDPCSPGSWFQLVLFLLSLWMFICHFCVHLGQISVLQST
jgi:hypothetical protein